jgi:hypothetical protein
MANISSLTSFSSVHVGSFDTDTSTGTAAVTGIGFKPEWILVTGAQTSGAGDLITVDGVYDGTTYSADGRCVYNDSGSPNFFNANSTTSLVQVFNGSIQQLRFDISSFDSDGFTYDKIFAQFAATVYYICGRG